MTKSENFCGVRYSRILAQQYGEKAALILQSLAFFADHFSGKIVRDDLHWFYVSIDKIAKIYDGIISRSTVHRVLQMLVREKVLLTREILIHGFKRTVYTFANEVIEKEALSTEHALYFEPEKAKQLGSILAAVMLQRFSFWLNKEQEHTPETDGLKMSCSLHKVLGTSRMSVSRALKLLQDSGMLKAEKLGKCSRKFSYTKSESQVVENKKVVAETEGEKLTIPGWDKGVTEWDQTVTRWDDNIELSKRDAELSFSTPLRVVGT